MGEREERVTYTEDEIRKAWKILGMTGFGASYIEVLLQALEMNRKDNHIHDFTNDDTITVKELRETWERQFPGMYPLQIPAADKQSTLNMFLRDISEHRENFPEKAVVQDPEGNIWRLHNGKWQIFGITMTVNYHVPHRPLKLLAVDKRRD